MQPSRRARVGPIVEVTSTRRSSILKKDTSMDDVKENAGNRPSSRRASVTGDKKRRVSFSQTDVVHAISPAKEGRRSILRSSSSSASSAAVAPTATPE